MSLQEQVGIIQRSDWLKPITNGSQQRGIPLTENTINHMGNQVNLPVNQHILVLVWPINNQPKRQ